MEQYLTYSPSCLGSFVPAGTEASFVSFSYFFLKSRVVDEVPETLYQMALLSHYFFQAMLRSAVPHRSENHGERGISTAEKARVIKPEASHEGSRGRGSKPEELLVCGVSRGASEIESCSNCSLSPANVLLPLDSPVTSSPKTFLPRGPASPACSLPEPANRSPVKEASPLRPREISAAPSDCSLVAARPPSAAIGATEREAARRPGKTREDRLAGRARASAWGREARAELAPQVNRPARRRALPPRPPSDFQARNSASRDLSLARSPRRPLAASAAAAASLHTKDCSPPSSTSTSSSGDGSPDSRARARRRRGEDLSLPATAAAAFFLFFYFA